jgi:4'-phosphopantetheinyl transferase
LTVPPLREGEAHVWTVALDDDYWTSFGPALSADEEGRAQRYYFEHDRQRFTVARTALRRLLGAYLQVTPASLSFQYSLQGKPGLSSRYSELTFNISHSEDFAILAFRRGGEIGVDIEKVRTDVETDKLAERFFSASERSAIRALPAELRLDAFYRCWTSKESLLKAWGTGLTLPLHSFDVEADPQHAPSLLATRPDPLLAERWRLYGVSSPSGYLAALATELPAVTLHQFAYQYPM